MANTISNADLLNAANSYPVGLKMNVLAGAAADTDIAVTNIATTDKIVSCLRLNRDATTVGTIDIDDLTAEVVILSAGNIQITTTTTTGDTLILTWWDKA